MRGRVMSLWTVLMLGTTPVCGPMIGYIAERFGPRVAYGQGGVNAIAIGTTAALIYFRRSELPELPAEPAMSSAAAGSQ